MEASHIQLGEKFSLDPEKEGSLSLEPSEKRLDSLVRERLGSDTKSNRDDPHLLPLISPQTSVEYSAQNLLSFETALHKAESQKITYVTPQKLKENSSNVATTYSIMQIEYIKEFFAFAKKFQDDAFSLASDTQQISQEKIGYLQSTFSQMTSAAHRSLDLFKMASGSGFEIEKKRLIGKKHSSLTIDFFTGFRVALDRSPILATKKEAIHSVNEELVKLLLIDFNRLGSEQRLSYLIDFSLLPSKNTGSNFSEPLVEIQSSQYKIGKEHPKKKINLFKDLKSIYKVLKKEFHIIHCYRVEMQKLAENLIAYGNSFVFKTTPFQKSLLDRIIPLLNKLIDELKKIDKDNYELLNVFPETLNGGKIVTYQNIIYEMVANTITALIVEVIVVNEKKIKIRQLAQLHSLRLERKHQPSAILYEQCIHEFSRSMNEQKNDREFLNWWYLMISEGMMHFVDQDDIPLLNSKKVVRPINPSNNEKQNLEAIETYQNQLEEYHQNLSNFTEQGIVILSQHAFVDKTFLTNFNVILRQMIKKYKPQMAQGHDPIAVLSDNFSFLESLVENKADPISDLILNDFNNELAKTNNTTLKKLKKIAKDKKENEITVVIHFMLRFYRQLNHKYSLLALAILKSMFKLLYPNDKGIFKGYGGEEQTRGIFIILKNSALVVSTQRKDRIDPGIPSKNIHCFIYCNTTTKQAYPGEDEPEKKHEIIFSYQILHKLIEEEANARELHQRYEDIIRKLKIVIPALGFPKFQEHE